MQAKVHSTVIIVSLTFQLIRCFLTACDVWSYFVAKAEILQGVFLPCAYLAVICSCCRKPLVTNKAPIGDNNGACAGSQYAETAVPPFARRHEESCDHRVDIEQPRVSSTARSCAFPAGVQSPLAANSLHSACHISNGSFCSLSTCPCHLRCTMKAYRCQHVLAD